MNFRWVKYREGLWRLYRGDAGLELGAVQQFNTDGGSYYGTWEAALGQYSGGRTGPMSDLEECQRAVESKVQ